MASIFLSYRRDDSLAITRRLADTLTAEMGTEPVFIDIASLKGGESFPRRLQSAIAAVDCVAVIIGPHWLHMQDAAGQLRLWQSDDYVYIEIATALRLGKAIVPVYLPQTAAMSAEQLPPDLQPLARMPSLRMLDDEALAAVAHALHRAALLEEIRTLPRMFSPALVALVTLLFVLGIPLDLQHMFGVLAMPVQLDQSLIALFSYGGAIAFGFGIYRAIQQRLWGWIVLFSITALMLFFISFAAELLLTQWLFVELALFGVLSLRWARQRALRHVDALLQQQ